MIATAMQRTHATHRRLRGAAVAATLIVGGLVATLSALSGAGAASSHASTSVIIATSKSAKLGTFLTSKGRTLYTLNKKDCTGQCLTIWPPVTLPAGVTKASAGSGVSASRLGRVKDAKGAWQVTYAGKALYWFKEDTTAGQTKGNKVKDRWGLWSAVVTKAASGAPTTTTTAPGGGGVSF